MSPYEYVKRPWQPPARTEPTAREMWAILARARRSDNPLPTDNDHSTTQGGW